MDYSQLSDFEINKLVAETTGTRVEETYQFVNGGEDIADHMSGIVLMRKITSNRKHWKLYDPCNNPADAYPLIYKNGISIGIYGYGEWGAGSMKHTHIDGVNPLRAAMIVFLMMQDANNA
jgi:hypothetical protein